MNIQNSGVGEVLREQCKLTLAESNSLNLLSNVQPVIDVTPRFHRQTDFIVGGVYSVSGGNAFTVTNTRLRTFITGFTFNFRKDATCDAATSSVAGLQVRIDNQTVSILSHVLVTLTADQALYSVIFKDPIEVDKASGIQFTSTTFTVGILVRSCTVYGYTLT